MLKNYKMGFDIWAIVLFVVIMIPTFIWSVIPAPNDILRAESVTALLDIIASVSRIIMIFILCVFINRNCKKMRITPHIIATFICCLLYFIGWVFYYQGMTNAMVILALTIPPCMAFIFYAIDRKNRIAIVPGAIFTICHLMYGIVNFIV